MSDVNGDAAVDQPVVLIVDDADDIRVLGAHVLRRSGINVVDVGTAGEALDWLTSTPTLPDAVVLDVQMPDMDGWQVLERLRADPRLTRLPVVLATVKVSDDDRARAAALGANGYVTKPYKIDEFEAAVRSILPGEPAS